MNHVREIPLDQLHVSEHQARTRNVDEGLDDLVANLRVHGQLEPIVAVSENGGGPPFSIISGQRRFLAHQRLGKPTITAIVREGIVDDHLAKAISISENLIRKNLTDRDLIDACTALYQRYGSVKAVAAELGLPYQRVRSCVKFERLLPQLKQMVEAGRLDVQMALRLQDHLEESPSEELSNVESLATELASMTRAQQKHFLETRVAPSARATEEGGDSPVAAHEIKQILVTLTKEDHYRLRAWAREQHLTQDAAGAHIISSFLSAQ